MSIYSSEHKKYVKKKRREKRIILFFQIAILVTFVSIWQILANYKIINTFLFSSPSNILNTLINLFNDNLWVHIGITVYETF